MRKRVLPWLLAAGCVFLAHSAGHARPVGRIRLGHVDEYEIVVVGTITEVQKLGIEEREVPHAWVGEEPVVETIELLAVSYSPEVIVKGTLKEEAKRRFRHFRFLKSNSPSFGRHPHGWRSHRHRGRAAISSSSRARWKRAAG